jgi:hypothetical protein
VPALDSVLVAGPWALVVLVLAYALPRLIVTFLVVRKVPADRLADVLRALAELFRIGR